MTPLKQIRVFHGSPIVSTCELRLIESLKSHADGAQVEIHPIAGRLKQQIEAKSFLIFIIPILGDNDLSREHASLLKKFLDRPEVCGCITMVVLKGDRHVDDATVPEDTAVALKINHLFSFFGNHWLCREKLDDGNAETVGKLVGHRVSSLPAASAADQQLDQLTRLLKCRPEWIANRKTLGFFHKHTGFSALYGKRQAILEKVGCAVAKLEPQGLLIRHAELQDTALEALVPQASNCVRTLDVSGNSLSLSRVLEAFPTCEWISMADNKLRTLAIENGRGSLDSLYLQKNSLEQIRISPGLPFRFKRLSFYRNRLSVLQLPDDQTQLTHINLGANPITNLPDILQRATELQFIGIGRTGITRLPAWLLDKTSLKKIDISYIEDQLPEVQLRFLQKRGVELVTQPGKVLHLESL